VRAAIAGEGGFSVAEIVIAAAVAIVALLAVAAMLSKGLFNSMGHQRQAAGLTIAQREIEDVRDIVARYGFDALAMASSPGTPPGGTLPANPDDPDAFVTNYGTPSVAFKVMESFHDTTRGVAGGTPADGEPLIIGGTAGYPVAGRVDPVSTATSGGVTATVHRYVTMRTETCLTAGACDGDSRRVVVAVVQQAAGTTELQTRKPVYLTTVIDNPVPKDAAQQPGSGLRIGVNIG
jgi:hypothetical protein